MMPVETLEFPSELLLFSMALNLEVAFFSLLFSSLTILALARLLQRSAVTSSSVLAFPSMI